MDSSPSSARMVNLLRSIGARPRGCPTAPMIKRNGWRRSKFRHRCGARAARCLMATMTAPARSAPHAGLILALTINGLAVSSYRDLAAVSQTGERYGFDSVWLCDHFLTLSPGDYVEDSGIAAAGGTANQSAKSLPLHECWTAL